MRQGIRVSLCLLLLVGTMGLATAAWSQEVAATLSGTVTDPSGAVVPGATVVVHNNDTNADFRTTTTNNAGSFTITHMPAGSYTVTVKSTGFKSHVAQDVVLNVAEKHTLDVQLSAGQVSETVEVQAENTAIQTTTAEQSGTITGEQVRELALNNRNFEQLILLQPGVANMLPDKVGFGLGNNTSISVNGARTGANNYTVDGADINDSGSNGTLLNTPSIDAIQEFTLERSNYDAAFGRSGGGQIVVATKSGSNTWHGSAYEFNRNNFYNANTFGARAAIAAGNPVSDNQTPIERYNDYGFTIGGPLYIPKVYHPAKNGTFFFWSEEWRKASTPGTNTINVPTAAELGGVFSSPVTAPAGAPAGCVTASGGTYTIAPSCFSQNATAYLNAFMVTNPPNVGGTLVTNYSQLNNFRQDIIRLDQNIGDRVRVFGRYMQDSVPQNSPFGLWGATSNYPGVETTAINAPGRNLVFNATANLSAKVVNEVEFVDSWGAINSTLSAIANSPSFLSQLTNNTAFQDPNGRAPNVLISGLTGLANGNAPYFERNIDRNIYDNLSLQHGNHTIRTGFTAMWMQKTENASGGAATFNFLGTNGNPAFANFLLGQADSYTQPNKDVIPHLNYLNFEAYVQDDWKLTPHLTLNAGVRYSYFPSPTDSNNTLVNFDPNLFDPAKAPAIDASGSMVDGVGNNAATYANGLIFPAGAACEAAKAVPSPLVSCSPFGSRVNPNSNNNWGPRLGLAWDPFGDGKTSVRAGYGLFYDRSLNGIWEQNAFGDPPLVQTTTRLNTLFDDPLGGGTAGALPLGPNSLISTGTPTFKTASYQDFNLSVQREVLPNTTAEVAYVGTKGVHLLGDVDINQPTVAARLANPTLDVNAIRPFVGYGAIKARIPTFTSNYNSLQVSLNRRFSRGLTVQLAYTWSKFLTDNPQDRDIATYDTYDYRRSYGPSILNTPQMFVISYVYELPFHKNQTGFAGRVLGGWQLSGITTIQSGQSLSITQSDDPFAADPGGLGMNRPGSTVQRRADQIGDSNGPKTAAEFFNTSAFAAAVGHFGSSAPGALLGPGQQVWDISLMKNTRIGERFNFQLRLETFNTFNHGNPSGLDLNFGDAGFGAVNGWHDPREVQLGAKLNF